MADVEDTLPREDADPTGSGATVDALRGVAEAAPPRAMFGRYLVLERLGRGAMGEVFAAYDPDLDRKVALKRLRLADDDDGRQSSRLLAEAQAMAKIRHPNVVTVFDVGQAAGEVFVAMELIDGSTLRQWLATPRPLIEVVDAFAQAARGLAAAHERGLVHRDFKPDNAMVDAAGRVQVVDFGLAGSIADRSLGIAGSPAYMAPELLVGEPATAASDQFALCVALFEAVYGARPFRGATLPELGAAIAAGRVTMPEEPRRVPRWLAAAIRRGLEVRKEDRWPSLAPLVAMLERHTASSVGRRVGIVGAVVVSTGLAALAYAMPSEVRCEDRATRIEATWNRERANALGEVFAGGRDPIGATRWPVVAAEFDRRAAAWQAAWRESCRVSDASEPDEPDDRRRTCLDEQARSIDATLVVLEGGDPEVIARIDDVLDGLPEPAQCTTADADRTPVDATTRNHGRRLVATATALRLGGKYRAVLDGIPAEDDEVWKDPEIAAELAIQAALAAAESGDSRGTSERLDRAYLDARRTDNRRVMLDVAEAYALLSAIEDRPRDGLVWLDRARAEARWLGDADRLAALDGREAAHRADLGEFDAAITLAQSALTDLERAGRGDTMRAIELLTDIGTYHFAAGRTEVALEHKRLATDRAALVLDPDHPLHTKLLMDLGVIAVRLGDTAQARPRLQDALQRAERAFVEPSVRIGDAHATLAALAIEERRFSDAMVEYERALANYLPVAGEQARNVALVRNNMSVALWDLGRRAEATDQLRRSIAIKEAILPPDHPDIALSYENLADQLVFTGDLAGASAALEVALAIRERRSEPGRLAKTRAVLARVVEKSGDHARAVELARLVLSTPEAGDDAVKAARRVLSGAGATAGPLARPR